MYKPTVKPAGSSTFHKDGTVSFWDVRYQSWGRLPAECISDATFATFGAAERSKVVAHATKHAPPPIPEYEWVVWNA